jgi:hypothetical protein
VDSFYNEDGGDMFLRNIGFHKAYSVPRFRRHSHCHEKLKSYILKIVHILDIPGSIQYIYNVSEYVYK